MVLRSLPVFPIHDCRRWHSHNHVEHTKESVKVTQAGMGLNVLLTAVKVLRILGLLKRSAER